MLLLWPSSGYLLQVAYLDEWCGLRVVCRVALTPESMDKVDAALGYP